LYKAIKYSNLLQKLLILSNLGDLYLLLKYSEMDMFGWTRTENVYITVFLVGPVSNIMCSAGYVFSMEYFQSHVVGNSMLLEPFVGQIFRACNQFHLPISQILISILDTKICIFISTLGEYKRGTNFLAML
jgi:hypothetical protein